MRRGEQGFSTDRHARKLRAATTPDDAPRAGRLGFLPMRLDRDALRTGRRIG